MRYIELFLKAVDRFLFFDPRKAEEKAQEIRLRGHTAEIVREKGGRWTVFELLK